MKIRLNPFSGSSPAGKSLFFVTAGVFLLSIYSCSKEKSFELPVTTTTDTSGNGSGTGTGTSGSLVGNWKFLYLMANTVANTQYNAGGVLYLANTTSDYTTTGNTGTIAITSTTMNSSNLGYTVNATAYETTYLNGTQFGSPISLPFSSSVSGSSSSVNYQLVGTDSIYFASGGIVSSPSLTGGTQPSVAEGGKYHFNGDTLFLTINANMTFTQDTLGVTATINEKATETSVLLKQ